MKTFEITRVVTRDVATDFFQGIRNFFGLRLRGYERVIDKHLKELLEEMNSKYNPKWFRINVNALTTASMMLVVYGEEK